MSHIQQATVKVVEYITIHLISNLRHRVQHITQAIPQGSTAAQSKPWATTPPPPPAADPASTGPPKHTWPSASALLDASLALEDALLTLKDDRAGAKARARAALLHQHPNTKPSASASLLHLRHTNTRTSPPNHTLATTASSPQIQIQSLPLSISITISIKPTASTTSASPQTLRTLVSLLDWSACAGTRRTLRCM
jgi:hypothetical protein